MQFQNLVPSTFTEKTIFLSMSIISFSRLVISYELGAIYFDISFFFSLLEDKLHSVFFISFMSVSPLYSDDVFLFTRNLFNNCLPLVWNMLFTNR